MSLQILNFTVWTVDNLTELFSIDTSQNKVLFIANFDQSSMKYLVYFSGSLFPRFIEFHFTFIISQGKQESWTLNVRKCNGRSTYRSKKSRCKAENETCSKQFHCEVRAQRTFTHAVIEAGRFQDWIIFRSISVVLYDLNYHKCSECFDW